MDPVQGIISKIKCIILTEHLKPTKQIPNKRIFLMHMCSMQINKHVCKNALQNVFLSANGKQTAYRAIQTGIAKRRFLHCCSPAFVRCHSFLHKHFQMICDMTVVVHMYVRMQKIYECKYIMYVHKCICICYERRTANLTAVNQLQPTKTDNHKHLHLSQQVRA